MKLTLAIIFITLISAVHARTWTSVNGVTTFEGEYVSSSARSLVFIQRGRKETIRLSRLSTADQQWVAREREKDARPPKKKSYRSLREQKVGKKLLNQTFRIKNKQFVTAKIQKVPQYYFLYYSASW